MSNSLTTQYAAELDAIHKLTDSVYTGRFLTEQKANRRNVTFLPVEDIKELTEPGIYLAGRFGQAFGIVHALSMIRAA